MMKIQRIIMFPNPRKLSLNQKMTNVMNTLKTIVITIKKKRLIKDSLSMCNKDTGNSYDNETINVKEEPLSTCDEDVEDSNYDNNTTNVKEEPLCTCDKNIENNYCYDNVKEELHGTCDIGKENNRHDYDKLYLKEEPVSICDRDSSNNCHENKTNLIEALSTYSVADQANTDKETMNNGFASDKITNKTNECYDKIEQARRNGCGLCGCSILRRRSTAISREHPTELQELTSTYIHNNAIREITEYDRVCHKCWQRAQRYADKLIKSDTTKVIADSAGSINNSTMEQVQQTSTLQNLYNAEGPNIAPLRDNPEYSDSDLEWKPSCIKLPDIKRASNMSHHCLFSNCETKSLHLIKNDLRIELLINQNYYVPLGSRICSFHLISNDWDVLFDDSSSKSEFTADHIEHIYSLLKTNRSLSQVNFEDVLNIDKCLLQYWTGLTKEKFIELVTEAPEVRDVHRGLTGLVALLMKHHRGDTYECLAKLMNISSQTLERLMTTVNELLLKRGDILEAFLNSSQQCKKMPQKKCKNLKILYI